MWSSMSADFFVAFYAAKPVIRVAHFARDHSKSLEALDSRLESLGCSAITACAFFAAMRIIVQAVFCRRDSRGKRVLLLAAYAGTPFGCLSALAQSVNQSAALGQWKFVMSFGARPSGTPTLVSLEE